MVATNGCKSNGTTYKSVLKGLEVLNHVDVTVGIIRLSGFCDLNLSKQNPKQMRKAQRDYPAGP